MATEPPRKKLKLPPKAINSPATLDDIDNLYLAFQSTPEMQDWSAFVEAIRNGIASGKDKFEVPAHFPRLAIEDIASTPLCFDCLVEVWNRTCDQEGMPEQKQNVPSPEEPGA